MLGILHAYLTVYLLWSDAVIVHINAKIFTISSVDHQLNRWNLLLDILADFSHLD